MNVEVGAFVPKLRWRPFSLKGWPETAEILTESGRPWPAEAAAFDLNYHLTISDKPISRRTAAERWNWTQYQARRLIESDEWRDPFGPEYASPTLRPLFAHSSPGGPPENLNNLEEIDHSSPTLRPLVAQPPLKNEVQPASDGPTTRTVDKDRSEHTTAEEQLRMFGGRVESVADGQQRRETSTSAPMSVDYEAVWNLWTEIRPVKPGRPRRRTKPPKRTGDQGKLLVRALKHHDVADVMDAIRWVATGKTRAARFLRGVSCPFSTAMRHVEAYADAWREHGGSASNMGAYTPDQRPITGHQPDEKPIMPIDDDGGIPL